MKNKFYQVFDNGSSDYVVNIVIAKTAKEAKVLGFGFEATECSEWCDVRAKAIREGFVYFNELIGSPEFEVFEVKVDKPRRRVFVYTDLPAQVDHTWELFADELKKQGLYHDLIGKDNS